MKQDIYLFNEKKKTAKVPSRPDLRAHQFSMDQGEEVVLQPIQGTMPGSKQEYWVALALYAYKVDFVFQYPIEGGRRVRGGQVIDFMVYYGPFPIPVLVQGEYWHRTSRSYQDRLNIERIKRHFNNAIAEPVELWERELQSAEMAKETVKRKVLGR